MGKVAKFPLDQGVVITAGMISDTSLRWSSLGLMGGIDSTWDDRHFHPS